jgi:hypothetical protein
LVGQEVPKIGGEGMETLRTSEDAKEWQEAVRSLLVAEIRDHAGARWDADEVGPAAGELAGRYVQQWDQHTDLTAQRGDLLAGMAADTSLADALWSALVRVDGVRRAGTLRAARAD